MKLDWRATLLGSTCALALLATNANATIITETVDFGNTLGTATVVSALAPDLIQGTVSPTDQNDFLKWLGLAPGTPYSFSGTLIPLASISVLNSAGGGIPFVGNVPNDGIMVFHAFDPANNPIGFPTEGYDVRLTAQLAASSVPEPASLALFGLGLAGMFGLTRRKKSRDLN